MAGESLDPGAIGPLEDAYQSDISVASASPTTGVATSGIQALSVAPSDYYYVTQTEAQKQISEKQKTIDIGNTLSPIYKQIEDLESKITSGKTDKLEQNRAKYEELKAYAEAERKSQEGMTGGAYKVTTVGYDQYVKDISDEQKTLNANKTRLLEAQKRGDLEQTKYLADEISRSTSKLDELSRIDPFSTEGQKKYPLKTTVTRVIEPIKYAKGYGEGGRQAGTDAEKKEAERIAAIRGGSGVAKGLYYDSSGNYIGPGSLSYAQMTPTQREALIAEATGTVQGQTVPLARQAEAAKAAADEARARYEKVSSDPKSTADEREAAWKASKDTMAASNQLKELASQSQAQRVMIAAQITEAERGIGITSKSSIQEAIDKVAANPYDPTITEAERSAYNINRMLKDKTSTYTSKSIEGFQKVLESQYGENAAKEYIGVATGKIKPVEIEGAGAPVRPFVSKPEKTGVGSKEWWQAQISGRELEAKENVLGGMYKGKLVTPLVSTGLTITPERVTGLTLIPQDIGKGILPEGAITKLGSGVEAGKPGLPEKAPLLDLSWLGFGGKSAIENVKEREEISGQVKDIKDWLGGVAGFGGRFVTTVTKPEYTPVITPALLPGGTGAGFGVLKTPSIIDTIIARFGSPTSKVVTGAGTAAVIPTVTKIPTVTPIEKATEKSTVVEKSTTPLSKYSFTILGVSGAGGKLIEASPERFVTTKIPDIKIADSETKSPNVEYKFTSLTPKNVDGVNHIIDTLNNYTKEGKPLSSVQLSELQKDLSSVNLSLGDKNQIATQINNYQGYAIENTKAFTAVDRVLKGDTSKASIDAASNSISRLSEYDRSTAAKYKESLNDGLVINKILEVTKGEGIGPNWDAKIKVASDIANKEFINPETKEKYLKYVPQAKILDEAVREIQKAASSQTPISDSVKLTNLKAYSDKLDKLDFVPASTKTDLKDKYKDALEVPTIYNKVNMLSEKAQQEGLTDQDIISLKNDISTNDILNQKYVKTDPSGKAIVDSKGQPVTSTYSDDIIKTATDLKSGYISPAQFKATNPLGFLINAPTREEKQMRIITHGGNLEAARDVVSAGVYAGYDIYKGIPQARSGIRSLLGWTPDEEDKKSMPELTKSAGTIGSGLGYGEKRTSDIIYRPLPIGTNALPGGAGISVGSTYEGLVRKSVGGASSIIGGMSDVVTKPFLSSEHRGVINYAGTQGKEFTEGLLLSPVKKPIETLASVGVGKVFALGLPVIEGFATRKAIAGAAKIGVSAGKPAAIVKYGLMVGLGAPYAVSVGERMIASGHPGYTLGEVIGSEILPMGVGAKLGQKPSVKGVSVEGVPSGIETGIPPVTAGGRPSGGGIGIKMPDIITRTTSKISGGVSGVVGKVGVQLPSPVRKLSQASKSVISTIRTEVKSPIVEAGQRIFKPVETPVIEVGKPIISEPSKPLSIIERERQLELSKLTPKLEEARLAATASDMVLRDYELKLKSDIVALEDQYKSASKSERPEIERKMRDATTELEKFQKDQYEHIESMNKLRDEASELLKRGGDIKSLEKATDQLNAKAAETARLAKRRETFELRAEEFKKYQEQQRAIDLRAEQQKDLLREQAAEAKILNDAVEGAKAIWRDPNPNYTKAERIADINHKYGDTLKNADVTSTATDSLIKEYHKLLSDDVKSLESQIKTNPALRTQLREARDRLELFEKNRYEHIVKMNGHRSDFRSLIIDDTIVKREMKAQADAEAAAEAARLSKRKGELTKAGEGLDEYLTRRKELDLYEARRKEVLREQAAETKILRDATKGSEKIWENKNPLYTPSERLQDIKSKYGRALEEADLAATGADIVINKYRNLLKSEAIEREAQSKANPTSQNLKTRAIEARERFDKFEKERRDHITEVNKLRNEYKSISQSDVDLRNAAQAKLNAEEAIKAERLKKREVEFVTKSEGQTEFEKRKIEREKAAETALDIKKARVTEAFELRSTIAKATEILEPTPKKSPSKSITSRLTDFISGKKPEVQESVTEKLLAKKRKEIADAELAIKKGKESRLSVQEIDARYERIKEKLIQKKIKDIERAQKGIRESKSKRLPVEQVIARDALKFDKIKIGEGVLEEGGYTFDLGTGKIDTPVTKAEREIQIRALARKMGYTVPEDVVLPTTTSKSVPATERVIPPIEIFTMGKRASVSTTKSTPEPVAKPQTKLQEKQLPSQKKTKYKTIEDTAEEFSGAKKLIKSVQEDSPMVTTLKQDISATKQRIAQNKSIVENLSKDKSNVDMSLKEYNVKLEALKKDIASDEADLKKLNKRKSEKEGEMERVEGQLPEVHPLIESYMKAVREGGGESGGGDVGSKGGGGTGDVAVKVKPIVMAYTKPSTKVEVKPDISAITKTISQTEAKIETREEALAKKKAEADRLESEQNKLKLKQKQIASRLQGAQQTITLDNTMIQSMENTLSSIVSKTKSEVKSETKTTQKEKVAAKSKVETKAVIEPSPSTKIFTNITSMFSTKPATITKPSVKAEVKAKTETKPITITKFGIKVITQAQAQAKAQAQAQAQAQTQAQAQAQAKAQVQAKAQAQAQAQAKAQAKAQTLTKVMPKIEIVKEPVKVPKLRLPDNREPWGYGSPERVRLGTRKIFQPIATGTQLLTGKGLFTIKYNVGSPSGVASGVGKTFRNNQPNQIVDQVTGDRMGLGKISKQFTSPDQSQMLTSSGKSNIGSNLKNMLKGVSKPALRSALKKKSEVKRKR